MPGISAPSPDHRASSKRKKIFVISTCQNLGIANSLQNITENIEIHGLTVGEANAKDDAFYRENLVDADHIFALATFKPRREFEHINDKITPIPNVLFNAYHPDLIYLQHRGVELRDVLSGLHSAIAFAAFRRGLSVDEALALFNGSNYRAFGYFDLWEPSRTALFHRFRLAGLRLEEHFYRWCRGGSFMHTTNHPKINVLSDIAVEALRRVGISPVHERAEIVDPLQNGPLFPVYEEIGEHYGTAGSYRFKPLRTNYTLSLREFVSQSFALYSRSIPEEIAPHPAFARKVEAIAQRLR